LELTKAGSKYKILLTVGKISASLQSYKKAMKKGVFSQSTCFSLAECCDITEKLYDEVKKSKHSLSQTRLLFCFGLKSMLLTKCISHNMHLRLEQNNYSFL